METVTRFVDRQSGSLSVASTPGADAARTLSATASYLLSEDGRKASLLSGGDGRSVQQITLQVPANRIGYTTLSLPQLKILQEVIALAVFAPFAMLYMGETLKWNYLWASLCLLGAVYFIFQG